MNTAAVSPVQAATADEHVFLIGRPPISEYLNFVTEQAVDGRNADRRALVDSWRSANDHVLALESSEGGIADDVQIGELDPSVVRLRDLVLSDPLVHRSFALTPVDVGLVELDRLVVHQKFINLAHVQRLASRVHTAETAEGIFKLCLPIADRVDPPTGFGGGPGGWTFKSQSNDFRVLGASVLDPADVHDFDVGGVPTHIVAVAVGYGANYVSAVHAEGRLLLWNGSHRAYALREAGHTHVPCLIQEVSRRDEIEGMGVQAVTDNLETFLEAPRPPILRDYFDERLRLVARVQPTVRQVQIGINAAAVDLPA